MILICERCGYTGPIAQHPNDGLYTLCAECVQHAPRSVEFLELGVWATAMRRYVRRYA